MVVLRLILGALKQYSPRSVSLYLGHMKGVKHLHNIPAGILKTHIAEDYLLPALSQQYVNDFESYWGSKYNNNSVEDKKEGNINVICYCEMVRSMP